MVTNIQTTEKHLNLLFYLFLYLEINGYCQRYQQLFDSKRLRDPGELEYCRFILYDPINITFYFMTKFLNVAYRNHTDGGILAPFHTYLAPRCLSRFLFTTSRSSAKFSEIEIELTPLLQGTVKSECLLTQDPIAACASQSFCQRLTKCSSDLCPWIFFGFCFIIFVRNLNLFCRSMQESNTVSNKSKLK